MTDVAALVLAAGQSTRFGSPKQLIPWGDTTLLGHVLRTVGQWPVEERWVVLGAGAESILDSIDVEDWGVVINDDFEEGLASSLRVGLDALTLQTKVDAVLIVLADQPDIPRHVVDDLLASHEAARPLVSIPKYRYSWGNPALVERSLWPRLMSLEGDSGAKKLFQAHPEWVNEVWFPDLPPRDVDSRADAEELRPRRSP
jgi:molybdenum cofactor cytidylyltransferase